MNRKARQEMTERYGVILSMGLIIAFVLFLNFCSGTNKEAERWHNKGYALHNLGRHEEALKAYEKAIEIKPDDHNAWYNLACSYSLKKEKDNALKSLRKAIENGFNDLSHIRQDKDLDFIRNEDEFKKIIDKL